jgi:hypothetical protein
MGRMVSSEGRSYHAKILAKSKRFANPCFDVTKKPKNLVKHFPPKFIVALHKMVLITFTNRGLSFVKVMSTILWSARKSSAHSYADFPAYFQYAVYDSNASDAYKHTAHPIYIVVYIKYADLSTRPSIHCLHCRESWLLTSCLVRRWD